MTKIPAGTKFHGVAASIDTRDKKSARLNALSEAFSIEDINETILNEVIETSRTLDVFTLLDAVLEDPFNVESWKASFTVSEVDGSVLNGLYEPSGDFSTKTSYATLVGIAPSESGTHKETVFSAAYFVPNSSEGVLGALLDVSNVKTGGTLNVEWTYNYEEDASAIGSEPKHLHDFRITVDSTQILGYVVINADDTEFHNFIIDSAAG